MPASPPPPPVRPTVVDDPDATLEAKSVLAGFRHALPEAQFLDVTIHDDKGELLWRDCPESSLNVEAVLRDAFDALLGIHYPHLEFPIDGEHTGVVLPAWAPDGKLAALAMLVLDTAKLDRRLDIGAQFLTAQVRAALKAIGASLSGLEWAAEEPPAQPAASSWKAPSHDTDSDSEEPISFEAAMQLRRLKTPAPTPTPARNSASAALPSAASRAAPAATRNSAELDRLVVSIRDEALELHVQPLARLRSSARTRRYEVLLRSRAEGDAVAPQALLRAVREHGLDSMLDRRVITQLMAWLVRHREQWKGDIPMFSVNLSAAAISDSQFFKFVDLCVKKAALPKGLIGFEITERACREKPECALRALETFRGIGCPVVIDDFSMHSDVLPLLSQPGIRLVKIDPQLTIGALGDRMREARVVSLVQAMRVLGMQTVAKRVEDEAEREWLTALGVDFVQSFRFMPPEPLEEWGKK
jgi:EAL domain-containing protein (putative c-di-GMP-specific phosphodiesterase class I)